MSVWGAAVRQFVPAASRGVLRWNDGYLIDDGAQSDGDRWLRGWASGDGWWRASTSEDCKLWTHTSCAASFEAACDAMADHLRAAGFEVPPRPEAT